MIDLKERMKQEIVFAMKVKTHTFNVLRTRMLFDRRIAPSPELSYLLKGVNHLLEFSGSVNNVFKKNRDDLEKLKESSTPQNQMKDLRLQDKLGKQNFHEDVKKVFETVTDTIKNTSEDVKKPW